MAFNVLIVDDSEVMCKVIGRVVRLSGFDLGDIYEAENGESTLSALDENWVDVVLSTCYYPEAGQTTTLK